MKIAIVTGAAQGIGRRTAEVLAGAGYGLLLMDRQPCADTLAAIRGAGVEAEEVTGDLTDEAVVERGAGQPVEGSPRSDRFAKDRRNSSRRR